MAKKQTSEVDWTQPRLEGKTFVLAGKFQDVPRKPITSFVSGAYSVTKLLPAMLEREQGIHLDKLNASVDYLIVGRVQNKTSQAIQQRAHRLNAKGASIELLDEQQFCELFKPTPEETMAMLRGGAQGWKRWHELSAMPWEQFGKVDLRGQRLRDLSIKWPERTEKIDLGGILFDGADLRGATITNAYINYIKNVRFDGANLKGTYLEYCEDCSFKEVKLEEGHAGGMTRCVFDDAKIRGWGSSFTAEIRDCSCQRIDLTGVHLNPANLSGSDFTKAQFRVDSAGYTIAEDALFVNADCRGARLDASKFLRADCRGADMSEAKFQHSDFTDANLANATFVKADLRNTTFQGADLRHADFTEANLVDADLRGAKIEGANFQNALLSDAKLDGLDMSQAKNFRPESTKQVQAGPNTLQLEQIANQSKKLETSVVLKLAKGTVDLSVSSRTSNYGTYVEGRCCHHPEPNSYLYDGVQGNTVPTAVVNLVKRWPKGEPMLDTVAVSASRCPMKKKELLHLATCVWCEAFGVEVPSKATFEKEQHTEKQRLKTLRKEALEELHSGAAGIAKWNARPKKDREEIASMKRQDFSGKNLKGVRLEKQNLQGSNFDGADLQHASLHNGQLRECSFRNANLTASNLSGANYEGANFEGANLTDCNLRAGIYRAVCFKGADLTRVFFNFAKLQGADLSEAVLSVEDWHHASFDESTKFPKGFVLPEELLWAGESSDPRIDAKIATLPRPRALDFAGLLEHLEKHIEKARLEKAMNMLKTDRFQLFSKIEKSGVLGVVKSQSSPKLVYSCRLTHDGHFACCSQNLKPCGGLRGALCKHLLVLVIGLCKNATLDPCTVYPWVRASTFRSPELDGDVMSEALLEYKGAETGQIDWRPTETIPEDFYAL